MIAEPEEFFISRQTPSHRSPWASSVEIHRKILRQAPRCPLGLAAILVIDTFASINKRSRLSRGYFLNRLLKRIYTLERNVATRLHRTILVYHNLADAVGDSRTTQRRTQSVIYKKTFSQVLTFTSVRAEH